MLVRGGKFATCLKPILKDHEKIIIYAAGVFGAL